MFLERKTIGRLEGKAAFYFGASQGATALADAVSCCKVRYKFSMNAMMLSPPGCYKYVPM